MKKYISTLLALLAVPMMMAAQEKSLHQLQQEFVDLRLGMFVHFGLPTYQTADWTDPTSAPKCSIRSNWTPTNGSRQPRAQG